VTTRYELIRMLTLNEIADDYEEPEHVGELVAAVGRQYGLEIGPSDVTRALLDLVGLGWAKAHDLRTRPPRELPGVPPAERAKEFYYWITEKGRGVQSSFEDWPFDEDGKPTPGWVPPVE